MTIRSEEIATCNRCGATASFPPQANVSAGLFLAGWRSEGDGKHSCKKCVDRAFGTSPYYKHPLVLQPWETR